MLKAQLLKIVMNDFTDMNCLVEAFNRVRKASGWKASTQKFELNLLKELMDLQNELRSCTYVPSECNTFALNENGRIRVVKALSVRDNVVQHSLCDNVLIPILSKYMIHDSGASLKNKGLSFTRRRFEQHLRWHYRRYKTEGYILKIDFRRYFDNIRHDILLENIKKYIDDNVVISTLETILKANEIDISFADNNYINEVFNSIDYEKISKELKVKEKFMNKCLGVGAPVSQISGIFFPTKLDNYVKTVKGIYCYDAYMDDRIIVHHSKKYLKQLLEEIKEVASSLGIFINERKTQIIKISRGFTFLKTKYFLTKTGKIIKKIPRDVIVRQRRKMKKLAKFVIDRKMTLVQFKDQYESWRGDKSRYNAYKTLLRMDELYQKLLLNICKELSKDMT